MRNDEDVTRDRAALARLCDQASMAIEDGIKLGDSQQILFSLVDGCMIYMDWLCDRLGLLTARPLYLHEAIRDGKAVQLMSYSTPHPVFDERGDVRMRSWEDLVSGHGGDRGGYLGEHHPFIVGSVSMPMTADPQEWASAQFWVRRWSSLLSGIAPPGNQQPGSSSSRKQSAPATLKPPSALDRRRYNFAKPLKDKGFSWCEIATQWHNQEGDDCGPEALSQSYYRVNKYEVLNGRSNKS